ncbi:aspartate--tRNA ligase [Leptospirillum ferriphilum]|uniref:Aspartate--tRNA(Asp/Asn) ligase n=3 Tax=Leptospirillum ferriphilum TaxID=178606 RepID=A0A059Y0B8_9BACT|nr:aspartate--tRNA ligase [Leptospirillum ferriphilum]AFS54096.1 aspartyl-tRNA synthetase [Leptospirillum ferriphilum ML-04]AIA30902.1 aspartyl-tRNA synthetase [Leptospirillum ferriphilum YSK]OOH73699.1 aspartate--tRNA ligase [Leptospirillum ferriphilum]
MYRSHSTTDLTTLPTGSLVTLAGWVQTVRDHGGLLFFDLRDREGLVQVVVNPDTTPQLASLAKSLRDEWVISLHGKIQVRPEGTHNPALPTGSLEVICQEMHVLNTCPTPPFPIDDRIEVSETLRLTYRYLDIRRETLRKSLKLRNDLTHFIRNYLHDHAFWEVETPILTRSTPEGARDFLVPSRLEKGSFYALPQSPQLFKQILMVGGIERYYQIARCFRDEDLRADRQPEFTQVDIEASFLTMDQFLYLMEGMIQSIFEKFTGFRPDRPFVRLTYHEAMEKYGSDKPDLRFGLPIGNLSEAAGKTQFRVFLDVLDQKGVVLGLRYPGGAALSRKEIDELTQWTVDQGAKGLAWFKVEGETFQSPILKFFPEEAQADIAKVLSPEPGDMLLFIADKGPLARKIAGQLRLHIGDRLKLRRLQDYSLLWVVDFPLFEWNEEENRLEALHHPFTAPRREDIPLLESDPLSVRSDAYDLVLNGTEIGGGSVRNFEPHLQERLFEKIGISPESARARFGFLLDALTYGAPPHLGMAFGLDRFVMLLAGCDSIRDVIAFPKTQKGSCLLTEAPSSVDAVQLKELGIRPV